MTSTTAQATPPASQPRPRKRREKSRMRKAQIAIERRLSKATAFFTYLLMNGLFVERSYEEVQAKRDRPNMPISVTDVRSSTASADLLLQQSEKAFDIEMERAGSTKDKCKALLTLCGFTLPALAFLAPFVQTPWLVVGCITAVLLTAWMLTRFLNVGTFMHPDLDQEAVRTKTAALKKQLAYDYLRCTQFNSRVNHFLTDVYRAAVRLLTLALILLFVTALLSLPNATRSEGHLARKLEGPVSERLESQLRAQLEAALAARMDSIVGVDLSQFVALELKKEQNGFEERLATRLQDPITDRLQGRLQRSLKTSLPSLLAEPVAERLKADSTFLREVGEMTKSSRPTQ